MIKPKLIRTATVSLSLDVLLKGQLSFLNEKFEVIAVSGQDKHLDLVREREEIRTISVEMQRNIFLIKDLKSLIRLYKVFKKEKPDIVHSITPKAGLLSMLAAKFAGVPVRIHMFTGLIFPTKKGAMQKLLIQMDKLLCWAATDILPEGIGVKQDLIKFKITKKQLNILANGNVNGIDISYYNSAQYDSIRKDRVRQDLQIEKDDFIFIFVGRLVSDKGINELVDAFKKVEKTKGSFKCKLLLVGCFESELDSLKKRTLKDISCNANIISVGYKKDVRPYLAISNALVFPSYREGFPNVVLQAGAMGIPSIVSDINGCNEIIVEGVNGLIIPSKDTEALQIAMLSFIDGDDLINKLKLNSRQMIVSRFEQSILWEALIKKYKILLSKRIG